MQVLYADFPLLPLRQGVQEAWLANKKRLIMPVELNGKDLRISRDYYQQVRGRHQHSRAGAGGGCLES
jgi:hypothetical protein